MFARLQSDHTADLVAEAAPSVVAVRSDGIGGDGSGVALGTDRVVTSAALVSGATAVTITTSRSRVLAATVAGVDPETDIALLPSTEGTSRRRASDLPTASQSALGAGRRDIRW